MKKSIIKGTIDTTEYPLYKNISLIAMLAMGVLIIAPALMAILSMIVRSIDFTMNIYLSLIKKVAFPFACSIVFLLYIMIIYNWIKKKRGVKRILIENPLLIVLLLIVILIMISQFYNGIEYALSGFCAKSLGETFGMELCYFLFVLTGAAQIRVEDHKRILLRVHIISSVVLVIAAFVLWSTQIESTFFSDWTPRFSSIFSNTNYYGYYLSVSVPITAATYVYESNKVWKAIAWFAFIANTIALSLNNTLGAWLGVAIALLFIVVAHFIIEKKLNIHALIILPVFMLFLYVPASTMGTFESNFSTLSGDISKIMEGGPEADGAGSGRWMIWNASLDIVKENKLLGIGFEGVKYREYVGPPYNIRPHNELIQYAMFHGIPVAVLYFIGCLGMYIRALRKKKVLDGATLVCLAGALGYLISSFFGLTLFSTAYFLFVFLGMGYAHEQI